MKNLQSLFSIPRVVQTKVDLVIVLEVLLYFLCKHMVHNLRMFLAEGKLGAKEECGPV